MKSLLIALAALYFGVSFNTANAAVDQTTKTAITQACKNKASGTQVTVDGKKCPCPAPEKKASGK